MSPSPNGRPGIDSERRTFLKALPIAGLALAGTGTATAASRSQQTYPTVLPLPTGFRPEGIVTGCGHEFYVGSLAGGAIYRGDLRTGGGEVIVPAATGRLAVGLSYDRRSDRLFVAGGTTGKAFVYDATNGTTAAEYDLAGVGSFVNDVVVTRSAAYFTDSFRPFLYRVPLGPGGRLPDQSAVETLPVGGAFEFVPGEFNANGIDAPPDAAFLLVVNSTTGRLYRVDPTSGEATLVDLDGESLTAGDGILLDGRTLYVVRNQLNQIVVVRLATDASAGEVVGAITDPTFDVPTTVAEFGNALYAVNARFGITDPGDADYSVVRVPKRVDA